MGKPNVAGVSWVCAAAAAEREIQRWSLEAVALLQCHVFKSIYSWLQANLDESQMSSPTFLRALMTAVCKAAIIGE